MAGCEDVHHELLAVGCSEGVLNRTVTEGDRLECPKAQRGDR